MENERGEMGSGGFGFFLNIEAGERGKAAKRTEEASGDSTRLSPVLWKKRKSANTRRLGGANNDLFLAN